MHVTTRSLIALSSLALASEVNADQIVYSQAPAPPPAHAVGSNFNWFQDADNFTLAGAGSIAISGLTWWGGDFINDPPPTQPFRVRFYSSSPTATVPGTLLTTLNIAASSIIIDDAGFDSDTGDPMFIYKANISAFNLLLPTQTRLWINIARAAPSGGWTWYASNQGDALAAYTNPDPSFFQPWTSFNLDHAFQVIAIPTPGVPALLVSAGTLVFMRRRRLTHSTVA